jgi:GntR family transcriptional regulator, uxu operon transcriptional repressor
MPVPQDVLGSLLMAIDGGRWKPGDRLPPERQLAEELSVGRSSLRIALSELERRGRIRRHVGQGTFVTHDPGAEVVTTLRISPPPSPADVFELRLMIEPQIAATAAMRASAPDIARLHRIIDQGEAASDWAAWETADTEFHGALATASRNPLLGGVLETVSAIRAQRQWGETRARTLTPDLQAAYVRQHRAIAAAVDGRDPPRAAAAMRDHLMAVNRSMVGSAADLTLSILAPDGDSHDQ